MRKKVKQCIQRSLCGILSAAMILTSLSVPEMTAYAAQPGGTEISEETSSEEVKSKKKEETSYVTFVIGIIIILKKLLRFVLFFKKIM